MKKQYKNGMEVFKFEVICVTDSNFGFEPLIVKQEADNALQAYHLVAQNFPNTISIEEVA